MDHQVAAGPCFVAADPGQFDTAVVKLAVNARDAMDGSGQLSISVRAASLIPALRGQAAVHGTFVVVAHRAIGTGIAPALPSQIFAPRFTTKGGGHGTGLGLSQVFCFARQSDGEIVVDSSVGVDTEFTLFLARGGARCMLLLEDQQDAGMIVRQSLEELDYTTVMTTSAEQALVERAADAGRVGAKFFGLVMTGMGGFALVQVLRRTYPALPPVLSSGYSYVLASEQRHGFQLLPKPSALEHLAPTLRQAVARTRVVRPCHPDAGAGDAGARRQRGCALRRLPVPRPSSPNCARCPTSSRNGTRSRCAWPEAGSFARQGGQLGPAVIPVLPDGRMRTAV